jgi:hypothetical protein
MPITSIKWDAKSFAINSQVRDFIIIIDNHKFKRSKTKKTKIRLDFKRKKKKNKENGKKKT